MAGHAPAGRFAHRREEDAVKGQRMLAIVSVVTVLAGTLARAQTPPAPPAPAPDAPAAQSSEPPPESERPLGDEEAMVLNFERADIREVIHSLATALGISYTIDPRIEGQVTIRTTGKISRRDLFPLFNQILRQNGIVAVQAGRPVADPPGCGGEDARHHPARRSRRDRARRRQLRHRDLPGATRAGGRDGEHPPAVRHPGRRRHVLPARERRGRDRPEFQRASACASSPPRSTSTASATCTRASSRCERATRKSWRTSC